MKQTYKYETREQLGIRAGESDESAVKREAVRLSLLHPGSYVTNSSAFCLFLHVAPRLGVFTPSGSCFQWYALNGKVKAFSNAQELADELATPMMG